MVGLSGALPDDFAYHCNGFLYLRLSGGRKRVILINKTRLENISFLVHLWKVVRSMDCLFPRTALIVLLQCTSASEKNLCPLASFIEST